MVHVREGQEGVERRVDRGRDPVVRDGEARILGDHFVFVRLAAIRAAKRLEMFQVEHGESVHADAAEIAAAPLDGERPARSAGGRRHVELRARVAAAVVGDALIRAEQVGSIAQQSQFVAAERARLVVGPAILEVLQRGGGHLVTHNSTRPFAVRCARG